MCRIVYSRQSSRGRKKHERKSAIKVEILHGNRGNQCLQGAAMGSSIGRIMQWASPINAKLTLSVSVVVPDTLGRVDYHLFVDVVWRYTLQHVQVADEDTFELSGVGQAVVWLT